MYQAVIVILLAAILYYVSIPYRMARRVAKAQRKQARAIERANRPSQWPAVAVGVCLTAFVVFMAYVSDQH